MLANILVLAQDFTVAVCERVYPLFTGVLYSVSTVRVIDVVVAVSCRYVGVRFESENVRFGSYVLQGGNQGGVCFVAGFELFGRFSVKSFCILTYFAEGANVGGGCGSLRCVPFL